jgi:hypothetical protein
MADVDHLMKIPYVLQINVVVNGVGVVEEMLIVLMVNPPLMELLQPILPHPQIRHHQHHHQHYQLVFVKETQVHLKQNLVIVLLMEDQME